MKKYIIISLVLILSTIIFWIIYRENTFVEKNFVKYTGINEFILKKSFADDHQSYIETTITNDEKEKLKKKFKFEVNLDKLKGRVPSEYISEEDNYIYSVIEDGYGPYGYILFALEKKGNTLKVYEWYGN